MDDVERALLRGAVEDLVGDLDDVGAEPFDGARGERLGHEAADAGVVGRIEEEQRLEVGVAGGVEQAAGVDLDTGREDALRHVGAEPRVAQHALAVGPTGQQVVAEVGERRDRVVGADLVVERMRVGASGRVADDRVERVLHLAGLEAAVGRAHDAPRRRWGQPVRPMGQDTPVPPMPQ